MLGKRGKNKSDNKSMTTTKSNKLTFRLYDMTYIMCNDREGLYKALFFMPLCGTCLTGHAVKVLTLRQHFTFFTGEL